MTNVDVEGVDLATLVDVLATGITSSLEGVVVGRTYIRDVVAQHLDCSMLEAERLVGTR